ncbi:unnamed protein product, partial [Ectocarpus sp. 4 AP-2014]
GGGGQGEQRRRQGHQHPERATQGLSEPVLVVVRGDRSTTAAAAAAEATGAIVDPCRNALHRDRYPDSEEGLQDRRVPLEGVANGGFVARRGGLDGRLATARVQEGKGRNIDRAQW